MKISVLFISNLLFTSLCIAQLNPASDLIGGPLDGISSGRYEIKKKKRTPANVEEAKQTKVELSSPASNTQATVKEEKPKESADSQTNKTEPVKQADSGNAISVQVNYHSDLDTRNNKLEIDVAPGVFYTESKSNFSYRSYNGVYPGVKLAANVWLNQSLGLKGQLQFSLGADVSGAVNSNSKTLSKFESIDFGINLRRHLDDSATSKNFQFELLYTDDSMKVPPDDINRYKIKSSGFGVGITVNNPVSPNLNWSFGGNFYPRIQHLETGTGVAVNSGSPSENVRMGLKTGWDYILKRQSQITLDFGLVAEKNQFEGAATGVDPVTGGTPNNVGVLRSTLYFTFGYRWAR